MNDKQRVLIGRIGAPHGVRGEVTIQSYAEDPRAIASYGPLETEDGKRRVELKIVRVTAKGIVARIAGIEDRNGVEALKGLALYVERSRLAGRCRGRVLPRRPDRPARRSIPKGTRSAASSASTTTAPATFWSCASRARARPSSSPLPTHYVPAVDLGAGTITIVLPLVVEAKEEEWLDRLALHADAAARPSGPPPRRRRSA